MLIALLLACAADLTDYRGGWREVECGTVTSDEQGLLEIAVDVEGPRPAMAWIRTETGWTPTGVAWSDGAVVLATGSASTEAECRLWVAE